MSYLSCYACGYEISGQYITALGRNYHPDCFVCQKCQIPIRSEKFVVEHGQPYHGECLSEALNLRCASCGELILGNYTEAMAKVWHPEHFVCTHCKSQFQDRKFIEKDGKPYCDQCNSELFLPRCSICQKPMSGKYLVNEWDDQFCAIHEYQFEKCSSCGRLVSPALTNGGVRYPDGRATCNICRKTAVDDLNVAWPAFNKVRRTLANFGIDIVKEQIPIHLVDKNTIMKLSTSYDREHTFGVTHKTIITQMGIQKGQQVNSISILHGLPWEHFTAVAAHEIGHAWLCLAGISIFMPRIEEGFCELISYLWLERLGTPTALVQMKRMEENKDMTYGDGFRMAFKSYQKYSLDAIKTHLQTTSNFP